MTKRITSSLIAAALLSTATGCIQSALNPDDPVTVTGKALNADGTPVANTDLVLGRSENSTCALTTSSFATVKTNTDGEWKWSGKGSDTQNGDLARCFRISLPSATDESYAERDFLVQINDVKVPDLQRWTGGVAVQQTNTGAELSFTPISVDGAKVTALQLRKTGSTYEWWQQQNPTSPVALSDEVLEDHSDLKGWVVATGEVKGSGTTFQTSYGSAKVTVTGHGKIPVSRGANCSFKETEACKLTDGDASVQLAANDNTAPLEAKITLPAAKVLKKAVFRAFGVGVNPKSVIIEGSSDGTTFEKLGEVTDAAAINLGYFEVSLTGANAVSVVRIKSVDQSNQPNRLTRAGEISLFE